MRHFIYVHLELLKHCWMEEEPDAVRKEEIGLRGQNHDVEESSWVFKITFEIKWTKLWDIELKVVPKVTSKIRIYSTFLKLFDCPLLMCIHFNHGFGNVHGFVSALVQLKPFLKSLYKSLLGNCFGLLTTQTTTKPIIKAATHPK